MADTKNIGEKECQLYREGMKEKIDNISDKVDEFKETTTTRLNGHATDIKDLTRVTIELAESSKTQTKTQETVAEALRILTNEVTALKLKVETGSAKPKDEISKKLWYEIPWVASTMPWMIKAGVVAAILVLAAAIGQNYLEDLKPFLTAK